MLGANDAVGGTKEMGDVAETDSLRLTLPENPLRLLRVMMEVPEDPMARLREFGEEVTLKSGSTNCHAVSACSSQCPSGSQYKNLCTFIGYVDSNVAILLQGN